MERKSKYKFYSFSNVPQDKGEFNHSPSLVDRSCKIPSLEDVIYKYVVNGETLPKYEFEDDNEEFGATDFKGFEVEDFRDEALETISQYKDFNNKKEDFKNVKEVREKSTSSDVDSKSINPIDANNNDNK